MCTRPPSACHTDGTQSPILSMSVTEIDISGLVIPRGPIAF
jgi:hypothetical protein